MSTKRINIRSIVLGIIAIAITITIGYGIAKAEALGARGSLDRGRNLGLRSALLRAGLRGGLDTRLTRETLLENVALGGLNLKGAELNSLDNLEGRLLG